MSDGHTLTWEYKNVLISRAECCAICGARFIHHPSVDHIIPIAVAKWNINPIDDVNSLYEELNDEANLVVTCKSCNQFKGTKLPTEEYIDKLYITPERKRNAIAFLRKHKELIDGYIAMKQAIYDKCNGRCCCGCYIKIPVDNLTIMRRDCDKPRDIKNGVIIANTHCNMYRVKRDVKYLGRF